jgi:hypothetical protein
MGGQESSIVTDYILKVRFASCNTRDDFFYHVIQISCLLLGYIPADIRIGGLC